MTHAPISANFARKQFQPTVAVLIYNRIPSAIFDRILRHQPTLGPLIKAYDNTELASTKQAIGTEIVLALDLPAAYLSAEEKFYLSRHLEHHHDDLKHCGYGIAHGGRGIQ